MLILRKAQLDALKQAPQKSFEKSMLDFVRRHFPKHCVLLGDSAILKVVQLGGERARQYRLETGRDVSLYISLMFMLGSDFDTDCQLPWASENGTIVRHRDVVPRPCHGCAERAHSTGAGQNKRVVP
jgi:hypothetical protein